MNLLIVSAAAVVVGIIIFLCTWNDMDVPEWLTVGIDYIEIPGMEGMW